MSHPLQPRACNWPSMSKQLSQLVMDARSASGKSFVDQRRIIIIGCEAIHQLLFCKRICSTGPMFLLGFCSASYNVVQ